MNLFEPNTLNTPKSKIQLERSTFEKVLPIWHNKLWPNRKTSIDPYSCLRYFGGYNYEYKKRHVQFWVVKQDHKIIGTISGFETEPGEYRIRGVYVDPQFRGQGVGSLLMQEVLNYARLINCKMAWILPRKESWFLYEKFGFHVDSDWFSWFVEYGPNCFASLELT